MTRALLLILALAGLVGVVFLALRLSGEPGSPGTPPATTPAAPPSPVPPDPTPPPPQEPPTGTSEDPASLPAEPPEQPPEDVLLDSLGTSHRPICGEGWYINDLEEGERRAREQGLTLLIIFEAEDCFHCRQFNQQYLADPEMAAAFRDPSFVVVKKFHTDEEQVQYRIRATPTFFAYVFPEGRPELAEWMPGLLEPALMRKRIIDLTRGRGRLFRQQQRLAQDPEDIEALKVILGEYVELMPPAEQVRLIERAITLEPTWSHGLALYVFTLRRLERRSVEGAAERLQAFCDVAGSRLQEGPGTARDHFIHGYCQLTSGHVDEGLQHLERSLALDPSDCEVHCHMAWALGILGAQQAQAGETEAARESFTKAYAHVRQALGYCPHFGLAESRKRWLDKQYQVLLNAPGER